MRSIWGQINDMAGEDKRCHVYDALRLTSLLFRIWPSREGFGWQYKGLTGVSWKSENVWTSDFSCMKPMNNFCPVVSAIVILPILYQCLGSCVTLTVREKKQLLKPPFSLCRTLHRYVTENKLYLFKFQKELQNTNP